MNNQAISVSYRHTPRSIDYRHLAHPLLLLANGLLIAGLYGWGLPLEATLTIAFMTSLVFLGIHEFLLPFRSEWRPGRREWLQNLAQFLPNGLLDNAGQLLALLIAMQFGAREQWLPLVFAIPLAIVVSEFFSYWTHRLGHEVPWLWKIHGIHHTPGKVNLVNTNTIHFLDMLLTSLFRALPLVLLGFFQRGHCHCIVYYRPAKLCCACERRLQARQGRLYFHGPRTPSAASQHDR
jgi:sterol desaturase/sphingolipid hydroxylase (fatty acid hydroxylase superfamily)